MNTIVKMSLLGALIIGSGSSQVQAKEVKFIFGLALAPYVIQESHSGFEVDIIRAALAVKGHTLTPIYASFALVSVRLWLMPPGTMPSIDSHYQELNMNT